MNDNNAASSSNTWDYRDEAQDTSVSKTPSTPAQPKVPATKGGDPETPAEGEVTGRKPWEPKQKSETPHWARKRFRDYSTTVSTLKDQNQQLMDQMREVLGHIKPTADKLKESDFPTPEAYEAHREELRVQKIKADFRKEQEQIEAARSESQQYQATEEQNVARAKADLPDYDEVIEYGDPDLRLPQNVVKHLGISPAGPYVKYRLAQDEELCEALKAATPPQRIQMIAQIHDEVLDNLMARAAQASVPGTNPAVPAANVPAAKPNTPVVPQVVKKAPPKAPPVVRSQSSGKNPLELSGDEFARQYNKNRNKRG